MMLRKIVSVWMIIMLCFLSLSGCADDGQETTPEAEQVKTAAEYEAEAEKQITEENASAELDKLEQAIEQETTQEP
jgi:predicted small lipoprotein YifL